MIERLTALGLGFIGLVLIFVGSYHVFGPGVAMLIAGVIFAALGFSLARVTIVKP